MRAFAGAVTAALLASACAAPTGGTPRPAADPAAPAASLAGTRWNGIVEGHLDARVLPRIEFTQDRIAGFTGCNMLSGTWRMENGEVHVGPLATTKRMCLGPAGDVEKRFLTAVGSNARVSREGGRLVFTAPDGTRFEFEEAAAT